MPDTSIALREAPSVATDGYFQIPTAASIQAAAEDVIPAVNGKPGIIKVFKSGLAPVAPRIVSTHVNGVAATTAAAGSQVTIYGAGFTGVTGATGVKFGSDNAVYSVVSDNAIVAVVPSGSSGSAPIVVKRGTLSSPTAPFTRS
jgi:hypothetical protein